jgi:Protein of unknown function (DUF4012)
MSDKNNQQDYPTPDAQENLPVSDIERPRHRRRSSRSPASKLLKRIKRRIKWGTVLIGSLIFILVISLVIAITITDAATRLNRSWQSLNRVLTGIANRSGTELTLVDFERLQSGLNELSQQIKTTQNRVNYLGLITSLNSDWQASVRALDVAQLLAEASNDLLEGMLPTVNFLVQGESETAITTRISSAARVVELLELGRGRFASAQSQLSLAEAELDAINLNNVSSDLILQIEQLRNYQQQLMNINATLLTSSQALTTIMGLDEERTYLVLAQNNDEIRPSGGYISTYGWFTIEGGRITDFDYSPTTATSPNPPNPDFLNTFDIPQWWIQYGEPIYAAWDGSWYADFPSTAQLSMDYYNAGGNPQSPVDGVLAIDITGFELILATLGDVFVEEYAVTVNANNFRDVVYDIRAFGEGLTPHKQFVATVYQSIFEKWQVLDSEQTPDLLGAMLEGLQSRHIMVYFADTDVNDTISQLGWTGSQLPANNNDYILVADSNLGNKSNNSIDRTLTYDVLIQADGSLSSRLSVRYDYFASVAENDPAIDQEYHGELDYRNLMQIFLPLNANILDGSNLGVVTRVPLEAHTLLVTRTEIAYDSSERYQIEYEIPALIETIGDYQRYRLLIQKQLGARAQAANVQITLPENATLISSSPEADASYSLEQPILDYRLELDSDQWIEVIYQMN